MKRSNPAAAYMVEARPEKCTTRDEEISLLFGAAPLKHFAYCSTTPSKVNRHEFRQITILFNISQLPSK
jgi:hypothetical protein